MVGAQQCLDTRRFLIGSAGRFAVIWGFHRLDQAFNLEQIASADAGGIPVLQLQRHPSPPAPLSFHVERNRFAVALT
jgi:hypothetical protein